jgi:hypothetical protein
MTGFTRKRIEVSVKLSNDKFGSTGGDTVTLAGYRMTADLVHVGGESMGELHLRVFGLSQSLMNQLTVIGAINRVNPQNSILLAAGDDENGMTTVFNGTISEAWADYNASPDVAFNVLAYVGYDALLKPVAAVSYQGSVAVEVVMADIAKTMGLAFVNHGVSVRLSNPYFSGTALTQARTCARAAAIELDIDGDVLAIRPKDGPRAAAVQVFSPTTGLIGYPSLSSKGMTVRSIFNGEIRTGNDIRIEGSIVPSANGLFRVGPYSHSLSCEVPDGPWFTTMECYSVSS